MIPNEMLQEHREQAEIAKSLVKDLRHKLGSLSHALDQEAQHRSHHTAAWLDRCQTDALRTWNQLKTHLDQGIFL